MVLNPGMLSALQTFLPVLIFTCMTDVQKKAQAELDAVIGSDRLPTLADRANLPYINAVVLEVLRWNSVTPTGSSPPKSSSR